MSSVPNRYIVYDCETDRWLPGEYRCVELMELLGMRTAPSKYVDSSHKYRGRYIIASATDVKMEKVGWAVKWSEEWDEVRERILRECVHIAQI